MELAHNLPIAIAHIDQVTVAPDTNDNEPVEPNTIYRPPNVFPVRFHAYKFYFYCYSVKIWSKESDSRPQLATVLYLRAIEFRVIFSSNRPKGSEF